MPAIMCRTILHTTDEILANFVQNQFCVQVAGLSEPDTDAITDAVETFYESWRPYMPDTIAATGHQIKFYELPGTPPNYPFAETTWDLNAQPTQDPLPSEVSLVTTWQAARTAGLPQGRRRGRMYLGPLGENTNTDGRPDPSFVTAIRNSTLAFAQAINLIEDHYLAVWSTVDQGISLVADGFVDNAYDTQRRRGVAPTSRTTWSLSS